jgi:AbrB family looped-hinge helix DNA binding protein
MKPITVSPKYQVVIPRAIREQINIKPGQKMHVIAYSNKIVLIPVRPVQEARGSLKGLDADVQREEADEER